MSAHVAALEVALGTQLIARSTRALTLTEAGRAFVEGCRQMGSAADSALEAVESRREAVHGTARLTASYNLGVRFLIPKLTDRPVTALFPSRQGMRRRVRLLVEHLKRSFHPQGGCSADDRP